MAAQKDMTTGSPAKILINFTIPILLGNIFQQLYNMVDTVIVGRFVGTNALAAVGATGTVVFFILGFLTGFTTGITVITSQRFGAGDMEGMRRSIGNSAFLSVAITVVMTVLSLALMKPILTLMQTPQDIFDDAYSYISIICMGMWTIVLYNLLSAMLRAIGNSKVPLYFLIMSAFLNVVLDLVFIINFDMGVKGAAWATVISQGVSGLSCFIYIIKKVKMLCVSKSYFIPNWKMAKRQMGVGLPMAFQFSIIAIGSIIMQTALNTFGSTMVAAFTAANKIEQFATQAFSALGAGIATYSAQNMGAGRLDRVKKGAITGTVIGCSYAVVATTVLVLFGKNLTALFVSENLAEITALVDTYLKAVVIFFIPLNFIFVYRNTLQGMGYAAMPVLGGIMELMCRSAAAIAGALLGSYMLVCFAQAAAWIGSGVFLFIAYLVVMRKIESKR